MNVKQTLVWPLTIPYGAVTRLRALAYRFGLIRAKRLSARVISVGNLTVGGTGKTPMVICLAQRLLAKKKRVGVLTRGYRGTGGPEGPTSDEVELLKHNLGESVPIGVGANRYLSGIRLVDEGIEWLLMDDGFQHLQLARDADIVLIDAMNPFGGGRLLPAGFMREPKSALVRASVVVITRSSRAPAVEATIRRETNAPIFYARPRLEYLENIGGAGSSGSTADAHAKKYFIFCGIGNPSAFVKSVRDWGIEVVGQRFFRDHHRYSQSDIDDVSREARAAGANALICTEKDRFNLAAVKGYSMETNYCHMSLEMDLPDQFWRAVETAVAISQSKLQG